MNPSLEDQIKGLPFAVVDFWAEWCGPCKMLAPILEKVAATTPGLDLIKVNVDEETETASKFSIRSIPTLLVFKNGKLIGSIVGAVSESTLRSKLTAFMV